MKTSIKSPYVYGMPYTWYDPMQTMLPLMPIDPRFYKQVSTAMIKQRTDTLDLALVHAICLHALLLAAALVSHSVASFVSPRIINLVFVKAVFTYDQLIQTTSLPSVFSFVLNKMICTDFLVFRTRSELDQSGPSFEK